MENKDNKSTHNISIKEEIPYIFDFDKITEKRINLDVSKGIMARLLILNYHIEKKNIQFTLNENSSLQLNILATTENVNKDYNFLLYENAKIEVALADFSSNNTITKMTFDLLGKSAKATWNLASLSKNNEKKIYSINFNHLMASSEAAMNNFGVVENNGKIRFEGINFIKNGAVKSKTYQNAKIMVFDENCVAIANPILKIDENDVEAGHASAIGKINDEHMFYLCSRGLKENEAKNLITLGYLKPIANHFFDKDVKKQIIDAIEKRI